MSEERKSAHTALIEALEHVEEMDDVLVLWTDKQGKVHREENDVTIGDAIYIVEIFKFILLYTGFSTD